MARAFFHALYCTHWIVATEKHAKKCWRDLPAPARVGSKGRGSRLTGLYFLITGLLGSGCPSRRRTGQTRHLAVLQTHRQQGTRGMAAGMLLHAGTPTGSVRAPAPPRPGVRRPALPARRRPAALARISSSSDATLRAIERAECFHSEVEALVAALPAERPLEQLQEQVAPAADSAVARAWRAYNAALEAHPVLVKSATSLVGFLLGDVLAQSIVGADYDAARTLRLVLFGMFMDGPVGAPPPCPRSPARG